LLNRSIVNLTLKSAIFIALLLTVAGSIHAQTKLLRFPDIYGDRVVFTYGGDLWTRCVVRLGSSASDFASGHGSVWQVFSRW
jgi:tricorn protease-like protein